MVTENEPSEATAAVCSDVEKSVSVLVAATMTELPGVVVPVTVTELPTRMLSAGAVTDSAVWPWAWRMWGSPVERGGSRIEPAAVSSVRRTNWPADHVSAEAEPSGLPLRNPIDAIVGSVPKGDGARSGRSHTCSAMRPTPELMLRIASSRATAEPTAPRSISYWPRSPASTGHGWPVPLFDGAHGCPSVAPSPPPAPL